MQVIGFQAMWVFAMFDLPVGTKKERKDASAFRKHLIADGFWMLQFSVYARPCPSRESMLCHWKRVECVLPAGGQVRLLAITDKQFERMEVFEEKRRCSPEQMPMQFELF